MKYDFKAVEAKWQKVWQDEHTFHAEIDHSKPKFYALVEFPYPSAAGLHVGHPRSYTALDIVARKKRQCGYNVLYPMGWDAFGLPTENYALKNHINPEIVTAQNVARFKSQLQALGLSFVDGIRRPDRDNAIDIYISDEHDDVLAEGVWQNTFKVKPEVLTAEEKAAWIAQMSGVTVGSDAFFPFGDNVERARKSGVQYIAQPGGSIRDDQVIATANKYGMVMAFTGIRLFHH